MDAVRFIGNVNEWSFDNLVIDNYFFGVSAVAKDGSETPVVFPGACRTVLIRSKSSSRNRNWLLRSDC